MSADDNPDDIRRCAACGATRPHTIARLNRPTRPIVCDRCHYALPLGERIESTEDGRTT